MWLLAIPLSVALPILAIEFVYYWVILPCLRRERVQPLADVPQPWGYWLPIGPLVMWEDIPQYKLACLARGESLRWYRLIVGLHWLLALPLVVLYFWLVSGPGGAS